MVEWTLDLMNRLGYVGIVLLMVLENLFPPLPSELILPAAGFAAARGESPTAHREAETAKAHRG